MSLQRLTIVLAALVMLAACSDSATQQPPAASGPFSAPEGVALHPRYAIVANTAFGFIRGEASYGEGFIAIIDRVSGEIVRRIASTQANPRHVSVNGDMVYVVNAGAIQFDPQGVAIAASDGGIDLIDLSLAVLPHQVTANIPLPRNAADPRMGGFGAMALSPDGRYGFLGSGTRGDVYKVDLEQRTVVRGTDNPIVFYDTPPGENGFLIVRRVGAELAMLNFNQDEVCLSSDFAGDLVQRQCFSVGLHHDLLEGPIDITIDASGDLLVLMSIANAVYRVAQPSEQVSVWSPTGLAAARVVIESDRLWVLNSLSNNLQRVDLASGTAVNPFAVFATESNPIDMAIDGNEAWVTLFGSNQLAVVDLSDGTIARFIEDGPGTVTQPCTPSSATQVVGIDKVESLELGTGGGFGQGRLPSVIAGAPRGLGTAAGSADVLSLGSGGQIVVSFGPYEIVDGPGPDFIVFENPFLTAPYQPFAEPAEVSVAAAPNAEFATFDCNLSQSEGDPLTQSYPYPGCAGVRPVLANAESMCIDPTDPTLAGGDAYDLSDVGLSSARVVRIRDLAVSALGTDTRGFDLDAIVLINYRSSDP